MEKSWKRVRQRYV